jgi:hypothetical protein
MGNVRTINWVKSLSYDRLLGVYIGVFGDDNYAGDERKMRNSMLKWVKSDPSLTPELIMREVGANYAYDTDDLFFESMNKREIMKKKKHPLQENYERLFGEGNENESVKMNRHLIVATNKIDRLVSDVLRRYNVDNSLNNKCQEHINYIRKI